MFAVGSIVAAGGVENRRRGAHIVGMKKAWRIMARMKQPDNCSREYFFVQAPNFGAAIDLLQIKRPDLANAHCENRGEARPEMLDWLQVDSDVFSIMVVKP
jgi:hypothetical protein